jgi:nitrate reductase assembly molybdenum cofactor insertion protein NarJ
MTVWMVSVLLAAHVLAGLQEGAAQEAQPSPSPPEAAEREAKEAAERQAREAARAERRKAQDEARRAAAEARRQVSERARQERDAARQRQSELYEHAMQELYDKDWEDAARVFSELADTRGRRSDAALYWKAYAEAKRGQAAAALATLERLRAEWPESRWQRQAEALAQEIRPGDAPALAGRGDDDELRLLALGRRLDQDPAQSLPALEKLLSEPASARGAERALFLLSQSDSKEARELLLRIARGQRDARLQKKAIEYVSLFGNDESRRVLEGVYSSAASRDVKRAVLRGYLLSGNKAAVLSIAQAEADDALRLEAIRQLGVMGARGELVTLVGAETSLEARKAALQALSLTGDTETLVEVARTGKDPALQAEAARMLGVVSREKSGPALVSLCRESKDPAVRRAALQGLFIQQNDQALAEVARKEKDPAVRRDAVRYLSLLGSSLSREFLSEMLDK